MAFKPNYRRDRPSDRGQHAHAPRINKEKRRRRLRCAKPSARQPKPRRMRSKRFDSDAIQRLYESDDYPLQRPAPD